MMIKNVERKRTCRMEERGDGEEGRRRNRGRYRIIRILEEALLLLLLL